MQHATLRHPSDSQTVADPCVGSPKPLRILYVEPDDGIALDYRRHLTVAGSGLHVCHVTSALAALQMLTTELIDCVLLEPSLPDAVGLAACDAFLAHPSQLPVVVLTSMHQPDLALEAIKRGVQDWLAKGENGPEIVARALQFALARRNNERHLRSVRERLLDIEAEAAARATHTSHEEHSGYQLHQLRDAPGELPWLLDDLRGLLSARPLG